MALPKSFSIDLEVTNRCNADCYFCPRDQTPHQGLMSESVFEQALLRAVELRQQAHGRISQDFGISICGLGEPLLNRHVPEFVRRIRDEDFFCSISSNGSVLDERRASAVLEAGLQAIDINVGEVGTDYDAIYDLPWERTRDNILRFAELAEGQCEVRVILVDHRGEPEHLERMKAFWRDAGLTRFFTFPLINRGGALTTSTFRLPSSAEVSDALALGEPGAESPLCSLPFASMVVGYDGMHYLCCSDWKKEVPLGSVFDQSFTDVLESKLQETQSRGPLCATCSLDPVNRIVESQRAGATTSTLAKLTARLIWEESGSVREVLESLDPSLAGVSPRPNGNRRRIPLRVE